MHHLHFFLGDLHILTRVFYKVNSEKDFEPEV